MVASLSFRMIPPPYGVLQWRNRTAQYHPRDRIAFYDPVAASTFFRDTRSKVLPGTRSMFYMTEFATDWMLYTRVFPAASQGSAQSVNLYWIYSITWINFFWLNVTLQEGVKKIRSKIAFRLMMCPSLSKKKRRISLVEWMLFQKA